MAKTYSLVIIPSPGIGHLTPTVQFAKTILRRDQSFSITVLVINTPFTEAGAITKTLSTSHPYINFIDIATVDPSSLITTPPMKPEVFYASYIELHKPYVKEAVQKLVLMDMYKRMTFIVDMFCASMIDVANEFNSACYTYFTSSSAALGQLHFLETRPEFNENDTESMLRILSYANPVPTSVLPTFAFGKDSHVGISSLTKRIKKMEGVIVNTFAGLEEYALNALVNVGVFPPLYPVGPLLELEGANQISETKEAERMRILRWLDEKEDESVVFLCFGSMGSFKAEQLKEIATGLEDSGVNFLWSVRKPPQEGIYSKPADIEDPNEMLPEGFLARTNGRGLICGWAPQVNILAHSAVGGFVSHCGWNSILESIWFGVPIAAWPLYAEQQINAFHIVRDLGLSVELKIDYRIQQEKLVSAAEVESAIKLLMASDGVGLETRMRVKDMSERSRAAVAEGGSSFECFGTLINKMLLD